MGVDGPLWVVVVAAGAGRRFGAPKQYEQLGDRRVLDWSLATARAVADGVVLVVPPGHEGDVEPAADRVVGGGSTRSESARAGVAAVPGDASIIIVHDAARPAATESLFAAVVAAVRAGSDGAVPGLPVVDTVKRVSGGVVLETLDRDSLVTVQTPQAFRSGALRAAHAVGGEATDDGALVERAGGRVVVVPGEPDNVKLTDRSDLQRLIAVLR